MSLEKVLKTCSHTEFLDIYTRLETTIHTNIVGIPYVTDVFGFFLIKERLICLWFQRVESIIVGRVAGPEEFKLWRTRSIIKHG